MNIETPLINYMLLRLPIYMEGNSQCVRFFLCRDSNQGKVTHNTTTVGWMWPGMHGHARPA